MGKTFNYKLKDAWSIPVTPIEIKDFDINRYEEYSQECDKRYADFLSKKEGIAVWQRVRADKVFRDSCRDMKESLKWQFGALKKSLDYLTDAPTYLEPWYGVGTSASAFGAEYEWFSGQAPAMKTLYKTFEEVPELIPLKFEDVPIMQYTLETIEYFLEKTKGRIPMSWCDIQDPINIIGGIIDISQVFMSFYLYPDKLKKILSQLVDVVINFTKKQSELIGNSLVRPGHGFASSRLGTGIGLSTDNLIMISQEMYEEFCLKNSARIGDNFGGTAVHSCGNWGKWIESVKKIPNLTMVDGAFSPETDPNHNNCEVFRDALVNTGIILHARIVGNSEEVISRVKRLWKPGMKLIVVPNIQNPEEQKKLYRKIHNLYL